MSATTAPLTTTTHNGNAYPSTDPNQNNPNSNPFGNGPSVYLYGFLATLLLIFLISIGVAWKGYLTRRLLRARIDDAIARGVLIPGYDPSNPNLPLFPSTALGSRLWNAQVMSRPVLYEEWIGEKDVEREEGEGRWDIKPTALDVLRPYDPSPLPTTAHHPSHATSLLNQFLDPLRQYWFLQPPEGADADQLQGRPGRRRRGSGGRGGRDGGTETLNRLEEEEQMKKKKMEDSMGLLGVHEVVASVFIAMPDRGRPTWGARSAGIANGGRNANTGRTSAGVASGSRPSSWQQQQQGVPSASRPASLSTAAHPHGAGHVMSHGAGHPMSHGASNFIGTTAAALEAERKELPELVLGVVQLGLREEARLDAVEEVVQEEERVQEAEEGVQGKEADGHDGDGGTLGAPGTVGTEKGKEPAVTSAL